MQFSHRLKFFSLIAALDADGGVGRDQTLPWKLRADMAFFRDVTINGLPSPLAPLPEEAGETGIQRASPFGNYLHSDADRGSDQRQNAVIMGRKTWDSLPKKHRPLVERQNIILSRTQTSLSGVPACADLAMALSLPEVISAPDVFVIGGGAIFAEAITHPLCQRLILTRIDGSFDCDVFFPAIPEKFARVATSDWHTEDASPKKNSLRSATTQEKERAQGSSLSIPAKTQANVSSYRFRFELWEC